jgi:hypothetical protein
MNKSAIFFIVFLVIIVVVAFDFFPKSVKGVQEKLPVEGFQAKGGDFKDNTFELAKIPSASYGNLSEGVPKPAKEPSEGPASLANIRMTIDDLKAFFGFEATNFAEQNDPATTLPLQTARSDLAELQSVAVVMERNPGLPSRITNKKLSGIRANLQYLRKQARALSNQGIEGFSDAGAFSQFSMNYAPVSSFLDYDEEDPEGYGDYDTDSDDEGFEDYEDPYSLENINAWAKSIEGFQNANATKADFEEVRDQAKANVEFLIAKTPYTEDMLKRIFTSKDIYDEMVSGIRQTTLPVVTLQTIREIKTTLALIKDLDRAPCQGCRNLPENLKAEEYIPQLKTDLGIVETTTKRGKKAKTKTAKPKKAKKVKVKKPKKPKKGKKGAAAAAEVCAKATQAELEDFQTKLIAEIARLSASGTTDTLITARVNTFNKIKTEIETIITGLKAKTTSPEDVPLTSCDIRDSLKIFGDNNAAIPGFLTSLGLPPAAASLFPGGLSSTETGVVNKIGNVFGRYMDTLTKGTSWTLNLGLQYDSERSQEMLNSYVKGLEGVGKRPININIQNPQQSSYTGTSQDPASASEYAPANLSGSSTALASGLPGFKNGRPVFPTPKTGDFDWKQRSSFICEQIRMRGMNPDDFGCSAAVQKENDPKFSYRGYTAMICSRLESTMDPGLPVSVGCPPASWPGWKS